jgi:hypothetical protein
MAYAAEKLFGLEKPTVLQRQSDLMLGKIGSGSLLKGGNFQTALRRKESKYPLLVLVVYGVLVHAAIFCSVTGSKTLHMAGTSRHGCHRAGFCRQIVPFHYISPRVEQ